MTSFLDALARQPWVEALGWTFLHSWWQIALVAALIALLLRLCGRRSPSFRYLLCSGGLALMAILPAVTLGILLAQGQQGREVVQSPQVNSAESTLDFSAEEPPSEPTAPLAEMPDAASGGTVSDNSAFESPAKPAASAESAASPASVPLAAWLDPLHPWIVVLWGAGVALSLLWRALALGAAWRLCRVGVLLVEESVAARLLAVARRLGVRRPVVLLKSSVAKTPMVIGWLRPVILFPAASLAGLPADQLEAILAHELAHIRRHDYLADLLLGVVPALFCFHPAVWWLRGRLIAEREYDCDDAAVGVCGRGAYLAALFALAGAEQSPAPHPAQAIAGSSLLGRVRRLAGLQNERNVGGWTPTAVLLFAAGTVAAIAACVPGERPSAEKTSAPLNSPVAFPEVALAPAPLPFEELDSYGEHGRNVRLKPERPLLFTSRFSPSDTFSFFIIDLEDWERPVAVNIVVLSGDLKPLLQSTWPLNSVLTASDSDHGSGRGGRSWHTFNELLPPPSNYVRLDVFRKAAYASADWEPSGEYAVCVWQQNSEFDIDADTIGLTSSPLLFDERGIARSQRLGPNNHPEYTPALNHPGDIDVFQLLPQVAGVLEVTVQPRTGSAVRAQLCVFDTSARRLTEPARPNAMGEASLSLSVTAGEPVYLAVAAADGTSTGEYELIARSREKREE